MQQLRYVIFRYYIFPQFEQAPGGGVDRTKQIDGTGRFSDPQSGYFHGWGKTVIEDAGSMESETVAIVEHSKTGYVHKVDPEKMRFVSVPFEFMEKKKADGDPIQYPAAEQTTQQA